MKITPIIRTEAMSVPRSLVGIDKARLHEVDALPECEAIRSTRYHNDAPGSHRCTMHARYIVDGKTLCARHAGEVALAYLVENS